MQLHPRETFTITRQLQNPFITDTQYVRAVIRNAKTDATLDTLDLTDKGSQRFTKQWLVPADVSGQGFWISIVTSVYSDSGYTTQSQNYGDEENTYLVQERFNHNLGVGGGGGPDINYKKIREIVKEEIDARIDKVVMPDIPKVVTVTKEVVVEKLMPQKEFPAFPGFKPILDAVKSVGQKVDEKPVTEVPKMDMTPMMDCVNQVTKAVDDGFKKTDKKIDSMKIDIVFPGASAKVAKQEDGIKSPMPMDRVNRLMNKMP